MIRWCAYCQRFLGESAPYDRLVVSHGLCGDCHATIEETRGEVSPKIHAIAEFFRDVLRRSLAGEHIEVDELIDRSRALGILPVDLVIGVIQPVLYELGRRFAAGEVPHTFEREFTRTGAALMKHLAAERPPLPPSAPRLLLGVSPGNQHQLGPLSYAMILAEEGIAVEPFAATLVSDYLSRLARGDCDALGLSVALRGQFEHALAVARAVRLAHPSLFLALGGCISKDPDVLEKAQSCFDWIADPQTSRDDARELAAALIARLQQNQSF